MPPGAPTANHGENGLWLRYTWYFGRHTDQEIGSLAQRLVRYQIRYAYFHVRGITNDGSLTYRFPESARKLTAQLHRLAPRVKLVAWIYAGNRRGEGLVEVARTVVRRRMVAEAVWLVKECGFDGVQWDYEICPDGDAGLLALMRETRAALPKRAILLAACPVCYPFPLGRSGWGERYYSQVAAACDQIAVMCYDTGFWLPRSYVWLVGQQAIRVTSAVSNGNPRCRVLLGVPTYGRGFLSHNPQAENMGFALRGVREGIADSRARPSSFAGVALFADYTTDSAQWKAYDELWLGPRSSP